MTPNTVAGRLRIIAIAATLIVFTSNAAAQAGSGPVKEVLESNLGAEINETTHGNVCTVTSGDTCQPTTSSGVEGGFSYPQAVAAAGGGDMYVADTGNHRVQEFEADGAFIRMFGRQVNRTAHEKTETKNEDVCPAKAGDECQAGIEGAGAGEISIALAIAVDPASGNLYIGELIYSGGETGARVQEFTPEGRFVLEIGQEVNAATHGDVCTQEEIEKASVICAAPTLRTPGTPVSASEPFLATEISLTVGGPEDLLYVGDEHRVQEFDADGKYKGELSLADISSEQYSRVTALAVRASGELFLTYQTSALPNTIYKFAPSGEEVKDTHFPLTLAPRVSSGGQIVRSDVLVTALAVDSVGRLAVAERERVETSAMPFGSLLNVGTGKLITQFAIAGSESADGVAFNGQDELYAAVTDSHEVRGYRPVPVGELTALPPVCSPDVEHESSDTFRCTLTGNVNPYNVPETQIWFQWGDTCALGGETEEQPIVTVEEDLAMSAVIKGLAPNETLCYRLAGEDENAKSPETLTSETVTYTTPSAPPKIVGEPGLAFVGPFSAVMLDEVNPEHASTTYYFEYGPCEGKEARSPEACESSPYPERTGTGESTQYRTIGVALEASGLQPSTTYHYRLFAVNHVQGHEETAVNEENGKAIRAGAFTTAPAPRVEAQTGAAGMITSNSALVTGTVNPDGQASSYGFELGVYSGSSTRYGTVLTGAAGAGRTPVEERLMLTGLQPGTQYAYRIVAHSGDGAAEGSTAVGATVIFTTTGEPDVLSAPSAPNQLPIPAPRFPLEPKTLKGSPSSERLAKALKACKKKSHKQRIRCEALARARYGVKKKTRR